MKREMTVPKENDLEGRQDMGGKHGGQSGVPEPEGVSGAQQGIAESEKGQEHPAADKARAEHVGRKDGDRAGQRPTKAVSD